MDSYLDSIHHGDMRDAALMLELAQGSAELGCRAVAAPITLATIGLEWPAVKAIAAELKVEQTHTESARRVRSAFADWNAAMALAAVNNGAGADEREITHVTLWGRNGRQEQREDVNGRYVVDFCPDVVPTLAARSEAVDKAGRDGRAWEC